MENLVSTRLLSVILAECSEQMKFRLVPGGYTDRVELAMCLLAPDLIPHLEIQSVTSDYQAKPKFKIGTIIDLVPDEIFSLKYDYERREMELKIIDALKDFMKFHELTFRERTKKEIQQFEDEME